jgi:DUF305 family protein family protein
LFARLAPPDYHVNFNIKEETSVRHFSSFAVGARSLEKALSRLNQPRAVTLLVATCAISSALVLQQATHAQSAATPASSAAAQYPAEAAFLSENNAAMDKMMKGMDVKPTGDTDNDFTAMMIPHHQGAIDMALAELRYGKNEQLRRIAQEIIVEQQQEINAMHLALGQPLSPDAPAPTQASPQIPSSPLPSSSQSPSATPDRAMMHDGMRMK